MRRAITVAIEFAAYLGLWFLLVGKLIFAELVLGVVSAALATLASQIVFESDLAKMVAKPRLWLQAWRLPAAILQDVVLVMRVLVRHVLRIEDAPSLLRAVDFDPGDEHDPTDATRRALAVAYPTVSPNFIAVGIDRERHFMLFHQIERAPVPRIVSELGADVPPEPS